MSYGQYYSGPRPSKPILDKPTANGKRVKQVYPTNEIPHLSAHKTQSNARNARGNFYFDGDTIYSYGEHFAIARHVTNKSGKKNAVLITTRKYSNTTDEQVHAVRCAIPEGIPVFHVSHPEYDNPAEMVNEFVKQVQALAESAIARKMETTRAEDVNSAGSVIAECRAFCKFFGLRVPKFAKLPKINNEKLHAQRARIKESREARNAARCAAWEAREANAKKEADNWNASGVCTHTPKHDAHVWGDIRNCEAQTREDKWSAHSAEVIEAWRNGDTDAHLLYPNSIPCMLRVMADEVETSRGARVPVAHAVRGLRFVRAVVAKGTPYVRNGHTLHLGHYPIDRIDVDGTLTARCHVIPYAEIERIAPRLEAIGRDAFIKDAVANTEALNETEEN